MENAISMPHTQGQRLTCSRTEAGKPVAYGPNPAHEEVRSNLGKYDKEDYS